MKLRRGHAVHSERERVGTMRRLWRAVEEFSPGGWAHEQLSSLALLADNVGRDGTKPSSSARDGLARRAAIARLAAVDRLSDIAIELARSGRRDEALRVERLASRIEQALAGIAGGAGGGMERLGGATELAVACRDALELAVRLRSELVGRVAVDPVPLLRWLVDQRFFEEVECGRLRVGLGPPDVEERPHVVLAGVLDLADAVTGALDALLSRPGNGVLRACVALTPSPESLVLRIDWSEGECRADPGPAVVEALLPLEAYGASIQRIEPRRARDGRVLADLRLASGRPARRAVPLRARRAAR